MAGPASPSADTEPVPDVAGRGRWRVLAVIVAAAAVLAIGLLGPGSPAHPSDVPDDQAAGQATQAPPSAGSGPSPSARPVAGRPAVSRVTAWQAGAIVRVEGVARAESGRLVITLRFGDTVLATTAVSPRDGRFSADLRPRVPSGGLTASLLVAPADPSRGWGPTVAAVVLDRTTVGPRSVDPATGRTLMARLDH